MEVEFSDKLRRGYLDFEKEMIYKISGGREITAVNAGALTWKLLQYTSGAIYDAERVVHEVHELKTYAVETVIKKTDGPLIVATAFQHEIPRLKKRFPHAVVFGDIKGVAKETAFLADWNAKKIPLLLVHPKSMSHGLNMQYGCNTLLWTSLTYSREDYEQVIGRLFRRGQDNVVMVHRLMVPDTIDYVIATVIEDKFDVENRLLNALQELQKQRLANKTPLKTMKQTEYEPGEWI